MNTINTSQLLAQLRLASAQASGQVSQAPAAGQDANFSTLLKQSIEMVNGAQQQEAQLKTAFQLGDPSVKVPDVMLAAAKADVAFQGMVQVRNRFVEAYQEIMRMQF